MRERDKDCSTAPVNYMQIGTSYTSSRLQHGMPHVLLRQTSRAFRTNAETVLYKTSRGPCQREKGERRSSRPEHVLDYDFSSVVSPSHSGFVMHFALIEAANSISLSSNPSSTTTPCSIIKQSTGCICSLCKSQLHQFRSLRSVNEGRRA